MKFGIYVFAVAALMLGLVGLAWGDFALVWQPVPAGIPGRTILADIVGALLAFGGVALLWRRSAAFGAATLTTLFALNVLLLHLPKVIAHPLSFSPYSGVAEQLALVAGALIAFASTAKIDAPLAARLALIGRIAFGACAIWFGLVHFHYPVDTATYIPKWLPPSQLFWAYATGVAHVSVNGLLLLGKRGGSRNSLRHSVPPRRLSAHSDVFGVPGARPRAAVDGRAHKPFQLGNERDEPRTGRCGVDRRGFA